MRERACVNAHSFYLKHRMYCGVSLHILSAFHCSFAYLTFVLIEELYVSLKNFVLTWGSLSVQAQNDQFSAIFNLEDYKGMSWYMRFVQRKTCFKCMS